MNAQGRAIALATCYVLSAQSMMVTTCPQASSFLHQHLEKYILYGDEAGTLLMQDCPGHILFHCFISVFHLCIFESVLGPSRLIILVDVGESKHKCCASKELYTYSATRLLVGPHTRKLHLLCCSLRQQSRVAQAT